MHQSRDSLTKSQDIQASKDTRTVEMHWQLGVPGRKTQENICLMALAGRSGSGKRIRCAQRREGNEAAVAESFGKIARLEIEA